MSHLKVNLFEVRSKKKYELILFLFSAFKLLIDNVKIE